MPANNKTNGSQNLRQIMKRVMVEAIFIIIICGVLLAAGLTFAGMAEEKKKLESTAETELLQLSGKLETLKGQMLQFEDALPLSKNVISENGESRLSLNRDEAAKVFLELKKKYPLGEIKVTISPVVESEDEKMNKSYAQAIHSVISIQMDSYTDEQVVAYLKEVTEQLPIITVKSFSLSKGGPVSLNGGATTPLDYSKPLIKASLQLHWHGIKMKEPTPPAEPAT